MNFQHYVNALPYVDKNTGCKTVLVPTFAESRTEIDQQIIRKNTETLQSLGYGVVPVPTRTYELTGGIHCLINVLQKPCATHPPTPFTASHDDGPPLTDIASQVE